jgi:hypothetical protein
LSVRLTEHEIEVRGVEILGDDTEESRPLGPLTQGQRVDDRARQIFIRASDRALAGRDIAGATITSAANVFARYGVTSATSSVATAAMGTSAMTGLIGIRSRRLRDARRMNAELVQMSRDRAAVERPP